MELSKTPTPSSNNGNFRNFNLTSKEKDVVINRLRGRSISFLDLSGNRFGNKALECIINTIVKKKCLHTLSIDFHNLNGKGLSNLQRLLTKKVNWMKLELKIKSLTNSNAPILLTGLRANSKLKSLTIVIEYEKEQAASWLIDQLHILQLKAISLTLHHFKMKHMLAIVQLMQCASIKEFSMQAPGWTKVKVDQLAWGITHSKQLRKLDLRGNDFSYKNKFNKGLAEALQNHHGLKLIKIDQSQKYMTTSPQTQVETSAGKPTIENLTNLKKLSLSYHAKLRMDERNITADSIRKTLSTGIVIHLPNKDNDVVKVFDKVHHLQVVVSLKTSRVITAYHKGNKAPKSKHWEDFTSPLSKRHLWQNKKQRINLRFSLRKHKYSLKSLLNRDTGVYQKHYPLIFKIQSSGYQ